MLRAEFGQALPIRVVVRLNSCLDCGDLCLNVVDFILDNAGFAAFSKTRTETRRDWQGFFDTGRWLWRCCLSGKTRLVIRVIPRIGRTCTVTQIEQTRDNAIEKIAVVRDDKQRARIRYQSLFEHLTGWNIEVVSGLIQHQEISRREHELGESHTTFFASTQ